MKSNVVGLEYWGLVIISEEGTSKFGQRIVKIKCSCGNKKNVLLCNLVKGNTKSCGCLKKEMLSLRRKTHGFSKNPLYRIFHGMKTRCFNKKVEAYKNYGGRGISICREWLDDFSLFYDFAINNGWRRGLEIDRKDNDKGYSPDNCRFVTRLVNQQNTREVLSSNTSGFRNVSLIGLSFKVTMTINGINHQKRGFKAAEDAVKYRDKYRADHNKTITPIANGSANR